LGRTRERVLAEPRPICSCSGPHTRAIRVGGLVRRLPFVCPPPTDIPRLLRVRSSFHHACCRQPALPPWGCGMNGSLFSGSTSHLDAFSAYLLACSCTACPVGQPLNQ
jgi:hypothetical protein